LITPRSLISTLAGRTRIALLAALVVTLAVAIPVFAVPTTTVNPNNTPSITIAKPSEVVNGSFMLASVVLRADATLQVNAPTGWTLLAKRTNTNGTPALTHAVYYKAAGASEPVSYKWTFGTDLANGNVDTAAVGGIAAYNDVDTSNPIENSVTNPASDSSVAASTNASASAVTTTTDYARVVALYGLDAEVAFADAPGMTASYKASRGGNADRQQLVDASDVVQPTAGSSGAKAATSASARWITQTVALRRKATKLAYTTSPQSGLKNTCLGPITVQTQGGNDPVNVTADTVVDLATDGTGSFFSDSGCTAAETETDRTIPSGSNSFTFYYKPTVTGDGTHQLTASTSGLTSANQTETVTKLAQTITFAQPSSPQTYQNTFNVNPTTDATGLTVSVAASGGCTAVPGTTGYDVTMTSGTTACQLTASQAGNDDYAAASNVVKNVAAAKKSQTITFSDAPSTPQTYGTSFHVNPTTDATGLVVDLDDGGNSEGCNVTASSPGPGYDVQITKGDKDCNLTASQDGDTNYAPAALPPVTVQTQKANQTITFDQPASPQTYGDSFAITRSSDSTLPVAISPTGGCSFSNPNVTMTDGTTACVLTASQAGNGNYNPATSVQRTVQASKRPLTVSGAAGPGSRVYDGTDNTTVDFSAATLNGEAFADVVEEDSSGYSAHFDDKNIGTGKPITVSDVVPATQPDDYTVVQPTGLTGDVTVRNTTAGFSAANKVYDGTTAATTPTRTVTDAASGDDVGLGGAAAFASATVGNNKVVTIAGPALIGSDASNYSLTSVGTDTANITKRNVTGSFTAADKDYDGTTAATITSRSLNNEVAGDAVSLTGGTATFGNPNPGEDKTVTGTGFSLGGADAGNYNLTSVGTTTATIRRQPAGNTPPPKDVKADAAKALGGPVQELTGLDLGSLGFAFAPEGQKNTLKVGQGKTKLFAIGGCDDPCTVDAAKTISLTTGGASTAATKKLKLKKQHLSLGKGEFGVVTLKLSKKQFKAIKKADKRKLVVKVTLKAGGQQVTSKKKYKLKPKKG
jgi:hypothetical protein